MDRRVIVAGLASAFLVFSAQSSYAQAPVTTPNTAGSFSGPYFGPVPSGDVNSIEDYICALIGSAKQTVEIANFTWSSQPIINALIASFKAGIKVRVVADSSETSSAPYTSQLSAANIPMVQRAGGINGIMHCKFIIIDQTYVWMGSANMTTGSSKDNLENGMCIGSIQLADDFETDFNQMFTNQLWGPAKTTPSPNPSLQLFNEAGTQVEADIYFSGTDAANEYNVICGLINNAQASVEIIAYELDDPQVGGSGNPDTAGDMVQAIINAKGRGVTCQVLLDNSASTQINLNTPSLNAFVAAGVPAFLYHPTSGLMHDKVVIVDGSILEFGSFNYTDGAATENDEDFMVLHDQLMAQTYQKEFGNIFTAAGGSSPVINGPGNPAPAPAPVTSPAPAPAPTTSPSPAPAPTTGAIVPVTSGSKTTTTTTPAASTASPAASSSTTTTAGGTGGCALTASRSAAPTALAPFALVLGLLVVRRRRYAVAA